MSKSTKYTILCFLAFMVIFMSITTTLSDTFENLHGAYRAVISAVLTAILAPRVQTTNLQSGKLKQVHWIFFKKPRAL